MEVSAKVTSIRITPRKMRMVCDLVRGKPIGEALNLLRFERRKAASEIVSKLIQSAAANASQTGKIDVDTLFVKKIFADQGVTMKRFRPVCKGGAHPIQKKTSHVTVFLGER